MKLVKHWSEDEYYIEINAAFVTDGHKYLDENWVQRKRDTVNLEAKIYSGDEIVTFTSEAKEYTKVIKVRYFWDNITEQVPIHVSYEEELKYLTDKCKEHIQNQKRNAVVTDGLPDSLLEL